MTGPKKYMEIQTRSEMNGLKFYKSLSYAFRAAKHDPTIWKISFNAEDGSRIRLVRTSQGWVYEDILTVVEKGEE